MPGTGRSIGFGTDSPLGRLLWGAGFGSPRQAEEEKARKPAHVEKRGLKDVASEGEKR